MNFRMKAIVLFSLIGIYFFSLGSTIIIDKEGEKYQMESLEIEKSQYVSLSDLKDVYGGQLSWEPLSKKACWEVNAHSFEFTLFSPYLILDEEVYNLTLPVKLKQGKIYIPFKTFWPVLELIEPSKKTSSQGVYNITNLKVSKKLNGILLEIFLTQPLVCEVFKSENNWLIINFLEGKLDTNYFSDLKIPDIIQESKAYQFLNSAQLSLRLFNEFPKYYQVMVKDPFRLQIILEDTTRGLLEGTGEIEKNPIDIIILDPGHGGANLGAVGAKGLKEKDIVLDIAFRVEELLKNSGDANLKVYLTRTGDYFVPLEQRSLFANQKGGDLFISIHANSAKRKNASGTEVYFLAQAKNDEARAVAALENSAIRFEYPEGTPVDTSELDFILMDMIQTEFLKESSEFAQMVHDRLRKQLDIPSRGVDQAGFFVLNKTYMPAILVETAFLSNQKEEKLLNQSAFRQRVAQAIYEGIMDFKNKYDSKQNEP
ncbi:MAG: N-acetylmuramoyl-L-alanine amidase [candidate division Zixibacteria bacterium]|nr:N-acetylmuramoyl-L-alanine amidase [candidate division Zixibacteria bacterium]